MNLLLVKTFFCSPYIFQTKMNMVKLDSDAEKTKLLFINMIFMSLMSGSEEDGLVSVPAEGSVSSGISSVVNMVGAGVGGGSRGTIGGGAVGSRDVTV